jgi:DNA-binding LytR/AlgR family response regulator
MKNPVLKTVIIDDEPQAVNLLTELAKTIPELAIAKTFTDPARALAELKNGMPDLLLLDVQMPKMSGFELLRGLRQAGFDPSVIFVTAYDQFAIEAIHNEAFDYLLKPVSPAELQDSVNRLIGRLSSQDDGSAIDQLLNTISTQKLQFPDRQGVTFIAPEEIIYLEADGNYSKIITKTKIHLVTRKLGELEEMLKPLGFIRVGRSGIINPAYLSRLDRKQRLCILQHEKQTWEIYVSEESIKSGRWQER